MIHVLMRVNWMADRVYMTNVLRYSCDKSHAYWLTVHNYPDEPFADLSFAEHVHLETVPEYPAGSCDASLAAAHARNSLMCKARASIQPNDRVVWLDPWVYVNAAVYDTLDKVLATNPEAGAATANGRTCTSATPDGSGVFYNPWTLPVCIGPRWESRLRENELIRVPSGHGGVSMFPGYVFTQAEQAAWFFTDGGSEFRGLGEYIDTLGKCTYIVPWCKVLKD